MIQFTRSFGPRTVTLELNVTLTNGQTLTFSTANASAWRCSPGPTTYSHTYGGEDYDARLEQPGWTQPNFAPASPWSDGVLFLCLSSIIIIITLLLPARSVPVAWAGPGCTLQPAPQASLRIMFRLPAIGSTTVNGVAVYDLGKNFAGWPAIQVHLDIS